MKVLLIDNYDSFTFNLAQLLSQSGLCTFDIRLNDQITADLPSQYDKILISPGPGLPRESGSICTVIHEFASTKSILGICLGHQAIAEVFGARLTKMDVPMHGQTVETIITPECDPIFNHLPRSITAALYHSWIVARETVPPELRVTARTPQGHIMGLSHRVFDVKGLQFHPESIATDFGAMIIKNWLRGVENQNEN
jgi:anthranilate synthase component 2